MSSTQDLGLFLPNNHSKYMIEWVGVDKIVYNEIEKIIKDNYEIADFKKAFQVKEWEKMSHNYHVICGEKEYLLRQYFVLKDKSKVEKISAISSYLNSDGIPTPDVIKTKNMEDVVQSNNCFWQLFEFVSGNHYRGTQNQLRDIASKIALLHISLSKIPFEIVKKPKVEWSIDGWNKIFTKIADKQSTDQLDKLILQNSKFLLDRARLVSEKYDSFRLKFQGIHRDLHPQNTIYKYDDMVALLDFADVCVAERARDVANSLHRFCRQFVVNAGIDWRTTLPTAIKIFLGTYNSINPLDKDEICSIHILIMDEILRKIFVDANHYLLTSNPDRFGNGEFEKKIGLLNESDYIGEIIDSYKT